MSLPRGAVGLWCTLVAAFDMSKPLFSFSLDHILNLNPLMSPSCFMAVSDGGSFPGAFNTATCLSMNFPASIELTYISLLWESITQCLTSGECSASGREQWGEGQRWRKVTNTWIRSHRTRIMHHRSLAVFYLWWHFLPLGFGISWAFIERIMPDFVMWV